jgi:hypothetical protein
MESKVFCALHGWKLKGFLWTLGMFDGLSRFTIPDAIHWRTVRIELKDHRKSAIAYRSKL